MTGYLGKRWWYSEENPRYLDIFGEIYRIFAEFPERYFGDFT